METTPAADYDSPWKEALAHYLPDALALFFPAVHAQVDWSRGYDLLDKELQQVTRDADLGRRLADTPVRVWRRNGTDVWVLIHIEVQREPEQDFARRLLVYHYRIYDRYERPIMSVAVLGDGQAGWRPDRFTQELWGCTLELRYPLVKLLDWRAREAELATSVNPFAVVVQAHLAAQATQGAVEARQRAKIALFRGLVQRGYTREQILELIRLIDWFVALTEEQELVVRRELEASEGEQTMAYVTSYERLGMLEGQRTMLQRVVQLRFGSVPDTLEQRIAAADQQALDRLAERITAASALDDLINDAE